MSEVKQNPDQQPSNPGRRTFLKGFGVGAAASATGGWGLRELFSRGGNSSNESAKQAQPNLEPSPTPKTENSVTVQARVWNRNRPDGSLAYAYPITPEERKDIERDVDNVGRAVKELFNAEKLKSDGVDIDQIVADMKTWDDKKISEWAHRSNTDRGRFEPDLEEVMLSLGETGIQAWYVDNTKTGEFGALRVSVTVDGEGKFLKADPDDRSKPLTTTEGLLTLPSKLSTLVKVPSGASDAYSPDKLSFTSHVGHLTEGGPMEVVDLTSVEYPTADGQSYQLSCSRRGWVYDVSVLRNKPDVSLSLKGKAAPIVLP